MVFLEIREAFGKEYEVAVDLCGGCGATEDRAPEAPSALLLAVSDLCFGCTSMSVTALDDKVRGVSA